MKKVKEYLQGKLDKAQIEIEYYTKRLKYRNDELEDKSKVEYESENERYQVIYHIECDISYLQYKVGLCQKDLDKYSEMMNEVIQGEKL